MDNQELEKKIIAALDENPFGSFGTIEAGNKPKVRYMAVFHKGLNVYLATNRKTHKVEELQSNPHVFLLLGYEQGGGKNVVEIEATASVTKNDKLRGELWNKSLEKWFKGPDDPDYVILELAPTRIEYMGKNEEHGVWQGTVAGAAR